MKNALRIGRVAGIGIYLHWTFLLLVAGLFVFYLYQGNTVAAALFGIALILLVFLCVILHELGHALTARRFGVPTRDITMYPIGGVARLERMPDEPREELLIAVAGPAVNLVIAGVLFVYLMATGQAIAPSVLLRGGEGFAQTLMWINIVLVGFNMLPAFPMDGGRVLRAILAMRMDYARATEVAANVGQGMAILFGLFGVISFNPVLLFIALFVYMGAEQEAKQATMRALTQGISVREAMMTRYSALSPDDTLGIAIEELLAGSEQDFPVVDDGQIVGVLLRKDMMRGLAEGGREARVGDVLKSDCIVIEDSATLEEAFARMQSSNCTSIPVVRNNQLVGMLTLENVGELMMVSSALRKGAPALGRARL